MPSKTSNAAAFTSDSLADLGFDTGSTVLRSSGFELNGVVSSSPDQPFTMVVDFTDSPIGCTAKVVWRYDGEAPRTFERSAADAVIAMREVIDSHF